MTTRDESVPDSPKGPPESVSRPPAAAGYSGRPWPAEDGSGRTCKIVGVLRFTLALGIALAAAGCGITLPSSEPALVLEADGHATPVRVEVADSPSERELGLSGRESLARDGGMVFLFAGRTTVGFWMKDTLIPLSIAFFDQDGRILRILDMTPCRKEPCRVYEAGVRYHGALEVNRGAFRRWGVEVGDRVRLNGFADGRHGPS